MTGLPISEVREPPAGAPSVATGSAAPVEARGTDSDRDGLAGPLPSDGAASVRQHVAVVVVALVLVAALTGWMIRSRNESAPDPDIGQQVRFEEDTGIRVLRVVMSGGGGLVELQYQVLDPDKALAVHDDDAPPALIDERSGAVVAIPFHEHKARELHTAVTYRELFMNGGGTLDRGSLVTLEVGDARIEHIEVG